MGVIVKSDGIYLEEWDYNEELEQGSDQTTLYRGLEILSLWHEPFGGFDENVTFRNLINILKQEEILEIVSSLCGLNDLEPWLETLNQPPEEDSEEEKITYSRLLVRNWIELTKHENDEEFELTNYVGMSAKVEESEDNYSCSWCKWSKFADCPLDWDPKAQIVKSTTKKVKRWPWERHLSKSPFKRIHKYENIAATYCPSFGEVIRDILMEVTWNLTPETAEAQKEEIMKRKEDIDTGEAKLYELDLDAMMDGFKDYSKEYDPNKKSFFKKVFGFTKKWSRK